MIAPRASNSLNEDTAELENRRTLRPRHNKENHTDPKPKQTTFNPPRRKVEVLVPTRKSLEEAKLRKQKELQREVEEISDNEDENSTKPEPSKTIIQEETSIPASKPKEAFGKNTKRMAYKLKNECDQLLEQHPEIVKRWRTDGIKLSDLALSKTLQDDVYNALKRHRVVDEDQKPRKTNSLQNDRSKREYAEGWGLEKTEKFAEDKFYVQNVCRKPDGVIYAIQNQFWEVDEDPEEFEAYKKDLEVQVQKINLQRRQEQNEIDRQILEEQQKPEEFKDTELKYSVNLVELPGVPKGAIIVEDPVITAYNGGNHGPFNFGKTEPVRPVQARESEELKTIWPHIAGSGRHECLLDEGSQIVSMSKRKALELGISWDPERRVPMTSANNTTEYTEGLAPNVPFTFGSITLYLQVHILQRAATEILLGRPFKRSALCTTVDNADGSVEITITDPVTKKKTTMPTYNQGTLPPFKTPELIQPIRKQNEYPRPEKVFHKNSRS